MLTIDDVNTLLEKYNSTGFWYKLDFNKIDLTQGKVTDYDFIKGIQYKNNTVELVIQNEFFGLIRYATDSNGNFLSDTLLVGDVETGEYSATIPEDKDCIFWLYIDPFCVYDDTFVFDMSGLGFFPISPTQIPVINGEFDNKFYIQPIGGSVTQYLINGEPATLQTDSEGSYLILPEAQNCILGCTIMGYDFNFYRITFREFKTIPQLSVSTLYRGTPQTIQLINNDTEEPITEFQAYYRGRKLKDNNIELPYDAPDVVNITIDLLDPKYPESTVKLKANTEIKVCTTQSELENAISLGIQTIQLKENGWAVNIIGMELNNITFVDSSITAVDVVFNNVNFITVHDRNGNIYSIQNNIFNNCSITNYVIDGTEDDNYNDCIFDNITSSHTVFRFTGEIKNSMFSSSLIISDGDITLVNNTFLGKGFKSYFPSFLYLTGEYTVKGNEFSLHAIWNNPQFNMCIIKTNPGFNPSQFIAGNTFDLEITFGDEPKSTFYYCLVDDDKIRAMRL